MSASTRSSSAATASTGCDATAPCCSQASRRSRPSCAAGVARCRTPRRGGTGSVPAPVRSPGRGRSIRRDVEESGSLASGARPSPSTSPVTQLDRASYGRTTAAPSGRRRSPAVRCGSPGSIPASSQSGFASPGERRRLEEPTPPGMPSPCATACPTCTRRHMRSSSRLISSLPASPVVSRRRPRRWSPRGSPTTASGQRRPTSRR